LFSLTSADIIAEGALSNGPDDRKNVDPDEINGTLEASVETISDITSADEVSIGVAISLLAPTSNGSSFVINELWWSLCKMSKLSSFLVLALLFSSCSSLLKSNIVSESLKRAI